MPQKRSMSPPKLKTVAVISCMSILIMLCVFLSFGGAKVTIKKAKVKTFAKSMRKTIKSIAFLHRESLNIDFFRVRCVRVFEE